VCDVGDSVLFREEWIIESELGREKQVLEQLTCTLLHIHPQQSRLDAILTATSEACLNAMEHGNLFNRELPVHITLLVQDDRTIIKVQDEGSGANIGQIAENTVGKVRDKLHWDNPRGWGLQLMQHCADIVRSSWNGKFCVELHFLNMNKHGVVNQ